MEELSGVGPELAGVYTAHLFFISIWIKSFVAVSYRFHFENANSRGILGHFEKREWSTDVI